MTITILCVDDEVNILNALRRTLHGENYRLLVASQGAQALEMLEANPVAVVISDQRMPSMKGTELLRQVKENYPDVTRILLSGQISSDDLVDAINISEIFRFVAKPWHDEVLRQVVCQSVERRKDLTSGGASKKSDKAESTLNILGHAMNLCNTPFIAVDEKENVLFHNTALLDLPSMACAQQGIDLKSFVDNDLLAQIRMQMKNPGLKIMEPISVDGFLVRPHVQTVDGAGYLIKLQMEKDNDATAAHTDRR